MGIFILDKVDFRTKKISRDKEGHYRMIKVSTCQEKRHKNPKYECTKG